jgi:hypothetical protein
VSKRDFLNYRKCFTTFKGKPIRYLAATNSLKLQNARNTGRGKPFIWIDPSWCLFKLGVAITCSYEYPYHTESSYLLKHRIWNRKIRLLHAKKLLSIKCLANKVTTFKFSGGYEIHSYPSESEEADSSYDDWYADNLV